VNNLVPEERALSVADLHIHTRFSDGADSPAEVVEHARDRGLHVIAITDHDRIDGALIAARHSGLRIGVEVIVGEEVSSRDGHILGLFLKRRIAPGMSAADTVAAIHDQNGLAIAAHPYWRSRPLAHRQAPSGVGRQIAEVDFDAVEVINGGITPSMFVANMRAAWAKERIGKSEIGGSDAHVKQAVGGAVTLFEGSTARALRKAIERGRTMARLRRPSAVALGRYIAWGLTPRPYSAREAV
jgi:predicted metal-dependent phosphoesterase TrpH